MTSHPAWVIRATVSQRLLFSQYRHPQERPPMAKGPLSGQKCPTIL